MKARKYTVHQIDGASSIRNFVGSCRTRSQVHVVFELPTAVRSNGRGSQTKRGTQHEGALAPFANVVEAFSRYEKTLLCCVGRGFGREPSPTERAPHRLVVGREHLLESSPIDVAVDRQRSRPDHGGKCTYPHPHVTMPRDWVADQRKRTASPAPAVSTTIGTS